MGGGDHTNVDFPCAHSPQPLELSLLQYPEELRLQFQRQIANFVQERRTMIGQFDSASLLCDRAGERVRSRAGLLGS